MTKVAGGNFEGLKNIGARRIDPGFVVSVI